MTTQTYRARLKERLYDGFMRLDIYEATVEKGEQRVDVTREVHDHGHGAAVMPVDAARKTALLVRQVRLPVHAAGENGLFLEVAAGLTDPEDADPSVTARREAREELGYAIHDLDHIATYYPIPGMVTEQMSCFLASYTPSDKIDGDTGADADEVLDVEEWSLPELWRAFENGTLRDGKAIMCLMALKLKNPALFD